MGEGADLNRELKSIYVKNIFFFCYRLCYSYPPACNSPLPPSSSHNSPRTQVSVSKKNSPQVSTVGRPARLAARGPLLRSPLVTLRGPGAPPSLSSNASSTASLPSAPHGEPPPPASLRPSIAPARVALAASCCFPAQHRAHLPRRILARDRASRSLEVEPLFAACCLPSTSGPCSQLTHAPPPPLAAGPASHC